MRHSLLLLGVGAALAIGGPAYSQNLFMDVNGSGTCTSDDALTSSITAVDVWLDSNHKADGTVVTCSDITSGGDTDPLDVGGFDIIVHAGGSGSVAFNSFDSQPSGFTVISAFTTAGSDMSVGYTGTGYISPGLVKLGTIHVTVTGTPRLSFLTAPPSPSFPSTATGFASHCDATTNFNFVTLGIDFLDSCGTSSPTPTESTTWGRIKQLYR